MEERVVIIGASITGTYATTALVRKGFKGKITLIDQEDVFPYNTYPLSKEWMMDEDDLDPPLLKKKSYYEDKNIDLRLNTRVDRVDWRKKTVTTDKGEDIPYDYLILATGSKLRKLDFKGDDARGIFYMRDFSQAKEIKDWSKDAEDVTIIGTGFIGLEFASSFSQLGKKVSVLVRSGKPLEKVLGADMADYFTKMHQDHGVNFLFGEEAEEFIKDEEGRVSSILTKSGKKIKSDMVLVAVGVKPNLSFEIEGLDMDGGVLVNEYGETSLPGIYAGGDLAVWPYKGRPVHIEHWEVAWSQGISIAENIVKENPSKYDTIPYFWTDQYDQSFEYLGHAKTWDRIVIRGSLEEKKFALAYLDKDKMPLAILFANGFEDRDDVEKLLKKSKPLDEESFKDKSLALSKI